MIRILFSMLLVALLTACNLSGIGEPRISLATAEPTEAVVIRGGVATIAPNQAATPATPGGAPTIEATATAPVAAPATPAPLPEPHLFDVAWDARDDFAAGLISTEQSALTYDAAASIYHLDLTIDSDYRRMSGREEVHYTNREEVVLNEIVFRLYPNLLGGSATASDVRVNGAAVTPTLMLDDTILRVPLPQPLEAGASVVIAMAFEVSIPDNPEGNFGSFAFLDDTLALAHAYPLIAEYSADEGGWEAGIPSENGDIIYAASSFYRVRLTVPAQAVVVASGTLMQEERDGEKRTAIYHAGPVRDFYLAMSENYIVSERAFGETTVRSYTYSNAEIGESVLAQGGASLETFNALIGMYPFTELEIAETPNLALGIEYPGVVVLTSRLYDPAAHFGSGNVGAVRESTVAHEVGHQWFYSTVGNDQLDEPWLDESLAQYITYRYFLTQYGEAGAQGFLASLEGRWAGVGERPIPIGLPVGDYTPQEYGAIIYGRGPIFFIALGEDLGVEVIDSFLESYYTRHKFGIATTDTLKTALEEACGCDLAAEFEAWIE